jgi:DNA-directed RNA polymerase specialized sigma24 family protein
MPKALRFANYAYYVAKFDPSPTTFFRCMYPTIDRRVHTPTRTHRRAIEPRKKEDNSMNPVSLLRSSWAAVVTLGLVMWAQVPHSAYVFELIIKGGQAGWNFALGFEAAVLMFVVRNMNGASWFFAVLSALINVKYYEMHGVNMWSWNLQSNWGHWLLSIANPLVIAMYSHILAVVQGEEVGRLHLPVWLQLWRMKIAQQVAEWRQGKEDASQDESAVQDDATLSPTVQAAAIEDATDLQPDPKEVARQLKSEGLSNAQIAAQLQTHPSTVGRWLNGASKQ